MWVVRPCLPLGARLDQLLLHWAASVSRLAAPPADRQQHRQDAVVAAAAAAAAELRGRIEGLARLAKKGEPGASSPYGRYGRLISLNTTARRWKRPSPRLT
ncbi:MAG: hypothetical protein M1826_001366 [Phylliscum demangeonii]|nr:MAG: hypothetical protein M1826_001366 [Phylliscum demangeonii]